MFLIQHIKSTQLPLLLIMMMSVLPSITSAKVKNAKPFASASSPQSVVMNTIVTLDGSKSTDSDGVLKKWQWSQTKGTKVKLTNAKKNIASFTSPKLKAKTKSTLLVFKLTVTDNKNATASTSIPITITSQPVCIWPQILENGVCVTPPPECVPPQTLENGVCMEHKVVCSSEQIFINGICVNPQPVCKAPQRLKNGVCLTPAVICNLPLVLQNGLCVNPGLSGKFNDTGLIECSDGAFNVAGCPITQFPQQDAEFGRDNTHYNDSDGRAGFSFTKISATGAELPNEAKQWACIKDNVTGLLWENKTIDGGLHDKSKSFSFYSPEFDPKNEYASVTDVTGFINNVNNQGLCGLNNWRLPTNEELQGILDYSFTLPGPSIDQSFFANTWNTFFWTSSPRLGSVNLAWGVHFDDGRVFDDFRNRDAATVRLVSGTSTMHSYNISENGQEVIDHSTGLIWQRCVEGKEWNGSTCIGNPDGFMFQEALQRAHNVKNNSGKNWRLPNIKELASLLDTSHTGLAIDENLFPNSPNDQYWTSSSYTTDAFFAWVVHFFYGSTYYTYTEDTGAVRLVRDNN